MKKIVSILLVMGLLLVSLVGCGDGLGSITVLSREDGSGTRDAFVELFGIMEKDASGNKIDHTIDTAEVTDKTSVMMTTVAGNAASIGYISLGSLQDSVKALSVDGVAATAENVKNDTYKISRPFNIATKEGLSAVAADFIKYILSAEGQAVVEKAGYISQGNSGSYAGTKPQGKITVAGSSSVTPVMEKLREAYLAVNTNAAIEVQQSDSTTGMNAAIDGICDIGMASRAVKDSELSKGLKATVIAMDGIAVIVNKENTLTNITSEQVKAIYTGTLTGWADLQGK